MDQTLRAHKPNRQYNCISLKQQTQISISVDSDVQTIISISWKGGSARQLAQKNKEITDLEE